jgi:hypothetical protein
VPILPGESLEDFDARLKAAAAESPLPHARDCDTQQYAALRSRLTAPAARAAPIVPFMGGRLARDLTPQEYAACLNHYGIRLPR